MNKKNDKKKVEVLRYKPLSIDDPVDGIYVTVRNFYGDPTYTLLPMIDAQILLQDLKYEIDKRKDLTT